MIRSVFFALSFGLAILPGVQSFAQADQTAGIAGQQEKGQEKNDVELVNLLDEMTEAFEVVEVVKLRDQMAKAFEARDLETLVKDLDPDAIFTWQNGVRNHGVAEFKAFYQEMIEGENSIVIDVNTTRELDGAPQFFGDSTAVAYGDLKEDFTLRDGDQFTLESKWTATLAKSDDQWRVVSYHVSADAFNNPMVAAAKSYLIGFATAGAVSGFLFGLLIMWFVMHSSRRLVTEL